MFNGIIKNTGIINKVYRKNNNTTVEILSNIKLECCLLDSRDIYPIFFCHYY